MTAPPTTQAPRLSAGALLAGRYRLERLLPGAGADRVWRGFDETLARPVALRVLEGGDQAARARFLAAAAGTGRVSHPGLARTFDAAEEDTPAAGVVALEVGEWVEGPDLARLVAEGPLSPARAVTLVAAAAAAVAALHEAGGGHGWLTPAALRLDRTGQVKVTGAGAGARAGGDPGSWAAQDTAALAHLLYLAVTGLWPGEPERAPGLPAAPRTDGGRPCSVRDVQARVPRALDTLLLRVLDPGRPPGPGRLATPRELAGELAALPAEPLAPAPPAPGGVARGRRGWVLGVVAAVVVLALGVGYSLAVALGRLPRSAVALPAFPPTAATAAGVAARPTPWPVATADSFDPMGNHTERQDLARLAYDGSASSAWLTDIYRTAEFGNLKTGVGLVFDLGRPRPVAQVDLDFLVPGQAVQLYAAPLGAAAPPAQLAGYRLLAGTGSAGRRLVFRPRVTARFWLVWFTRLPAVAGGFQGDIAEARFLS